MNASVKVGIVVVLAAAIVGVVVLKERGAAPEGAPARSTTGPAAANAAARGTPLPRLIELGSTLCVPCKMMEPVLAELRRDYAGKLQVDFINVYEDAAAAEKYKIRVIPTQIFLDASGAERFRHEGFFSKEDILSKWAELGIRLSSEPSSRLERLDPVKPDVRPRETVCHLCDGTVAPRTRVVIRTDKGDVHLCGPHCYFILYSSLSTDPTGFEKNVSVTDWATGALVPAADATYLRGTEKESGRPWIKAFAGASAAEKERATSGGAPVRFDALQKEELSHRCGFCGRACYPADAAGVIVAEWQESCCGGGRPVIVGRTLGCCPLCALGVAAKEQKDIEVEQADALTGETVRVTTQNLEVMNLAPPTAVAWHGLKRGKGGKVASAGCFHQFFFASDENLRKWLASHPEETGRRITIQQALADKMKLSPQQIEKACKIGECAPK